jgi:hypothetical protein
VPKETLQHLDLCLEVRMVRAVAVRLDLIAGMNLLIPEENKEPRMFSPMLCAADQY